MTRPSNENDPHDQGLARDLPLLLTRRRIVTALGITGASALAGAYMLSGPGQAEANLTGTAADGSVCVKHPVETGGPFPADGTNVKDGQIVNALTEGGVVREDIRQSFGAMTPVAEGVRLDLLITLVNVNAVCAPLADHAVYIWHCDAEGHYSLYEKTDRNYLRGVGVTDDKGQVRFTTVFPACYDGRWPHIHVEVFTDLETAVSGDASLLISQFAFSEADAESVYSVDARYNASVANMGRVSLSSDNVFADNTAEQIVAQTITVMGSPAEGLAGSVTLGVTKG